MSQNLLEELESIKRDNALLRKSLKETEERARRAEERANKFDRTGQIGKHREDRGDWLTHVIREFVKKEYEDGMTLSELHNKLTKYFYEDSFVGLFDFLKHARKRRPFMGRPYEFISLSPSHLKKNSGKGEYVLTVKIRTKSGWINKDIDSYKIYSRLSRAKNKFVNG